jgi:prepilin-type N-terminal cleavage/methylation domain-containing protein
MSSRCKYRSRGFSLLEVLVGIAIVMILVAITAPAVNRALNTARVRDTAVQYANLLQTARSQAIADDRFYSVYVQPAAGGNPPIAYVDIQPQVNNGTSGHGPPPTGHYDAGPPADPASNLSGQVLPQPVAGAPNVNALNAAFCAACVPARIFNTAPTWGPDGMPCEAKPSLDGTGTVCNGSGGPTAYVTYFQSTVSAEWSAVTVSPAGRVKAWLYIQGSGGGGQWAAQ